MGRKLDLGELNDEEEKIIMQVIKRDYNVRKVETNRIGKLSKSVDSEEQKQKEVVKEAVQGDVPIDSLCARCGKKFMWLINPKAQCSGCDLYFCKNKIDCIVYDKLTQKCFCNACLKQRDFQAYAGDWFYSKLKGKFRRHGGAKVSRELNKRRKRRTSESDSSLPPMKPPRLGFNDERSLSPSSSIASTPVSVRRQLSDRSFDSSTWQQSDRSYETSSIRSSESKNLSALETQTEESETQSHSLDASVRQNYDVEMDAVVIETNFAPSQTHEMQVQTNGDFSHDIDVQTEETEENKISEIKLELEAAISKILLPKLEELKKSQFQEQTELERQQKMEDAVLIAEQMIDKALERAREKHAHMPDGPEENILLTKYLMESKPELMSKFTSQIHDKAFFHQNGQISARSSVKEAGTMTETSDSEMESLSSQSDRKRTKDVPLSERLGSLSPDSLRNTLNQSLDSSITQGVVLQKDQLVARADIDNTLEQILDEQGVKVYGTNSPQEFSTELKFTAVGGGKRRRLSTEEISDNSDDSASETTSEKLLNDQENWLTPGVTKRPSQFGKTSNTNSSNSLMSFQNQIKSPYSNLDEADSDSEDREHVQEEQVLASLVRRPDGPMSPPAIMKQQVELTDKLPEKKAHLPVDVAVDPKLIESLSEDLAEKTKNGKKKQIETPKHSPVVEQIIEAVDREAKEFQTPDTVEYENDVHVQREYSTDIGLFRPGSPSSESELSAIPETEENSDTDTDSGNVSAEKRKKNSLLQPARHSVSQNITHQKKQLSNEDTMITDDVDFGDKMIEALAAQQRKAYEPEQMEITIDTSLPDEDHKRESESSDEGSDNEDRNTPTITPTPRDDFGIDESAVAIRMINNKSLETISDTIQSIEKVQGHSSSDESHSSDSESSKTYSAHGSTEELHKMNEAEEEIYKNAAKTYVLEEKLEQLEREADGLNRFDPDSEAKLQQLEREVDSAETRVEEITTGAKSIDEIMQQLRGAGLKAERGGFKRSSLDSATTINPEQKKSYARYSLPPPSKPQRPVNAISNNDDFHTTSGNTFTVIPSRTGGTAQIIHSTPKARSTSVSSTSSMSSSSTLSKSLPSTPRSKSVDAGLPRSFSEDSSDPKPIQATIAAPVHTSLPSVDPVETTITTHTSLHGTSTHSSNSSTSTHSRTSSVDSHDKKFKDEKVKDSPVVVSKPESSISSHSATSIHSIATTSSDHSTADEEIKEFSYKAGLSAQELEESRIPTPTPRKRNEIKTTEESEALPAVVKENSEVKYEESIEESLPAQGVRNMVTKLEDGLKSSSESGTEYTEPLIKQGMRSGSELDEKKKEKLLKKKRLIYQSNYSTDSESDAGEYKSRKSRLKKDDSWMKRESDVDSDTGSVTSTSSRSSRRSTETGASSRSLFGNLTAAEQREMARIALMHLPETAIAEDRYKTKSINFVRKSSNIEKETQSEILPAVETTPTLKISVQEEESAPPTKPNEVITKADVHISGVSPSSSPRIAKRLTIGDAKELFESKSTPQTNSNEGILKRTSYVDNDLRNSLEEKPICILERNGEAGYTVHSTSNLEPPSDLDRSQAVRGSITMRSGKVQMLSTSPGGKPEFQDF